MKKFFIYITFLLLASACNPLDDIYSDLDEDKPSYTKEVAYTFTSDDYKSASAAALAAAVTAEDSTYAYAVKNDLAFNDSVTAANYIGGVLADVYVALESGSVAQVSYNFISKNAETDLDNSLMSFATADKYTVSTEDYASVSEVVGENESFFPSATAEDYIPSILLAADSTAVAGDVTVVAYSYSAQEPGTIAEPVVTEYSYDFNGIGDKIDLEDQFGWSQVMAVGDRGWQFREYSENGYLQFSAFGASGDVSTYAISPLMNIVSSSQMVFESKYGYYVGDVVEVLVSSDYTGDVTTATWTDLTSQVAFPEQVTSGYGTSFESSGTIDLSAYEGTVNVAFKYTGDTTLTTTFQLDNFSVSAVASKSSELATAESFNAIYTFDGSEWAISTEAIVLNNADYDAMGAPGKYNNFSESTPAIDYLPNYLASTKPYAFEGESIIVLYNYYPADNNFVADYYTYTGGVWSLSSASEGNIEVLTSPFFHGTAGWILDPTERFAIAASEYQTCVDWVKDNMENGADYVDSYGNTEYYYGFASYYANIDLRLSKRSAIPFTQAEIDKYGVTAWDDASSKDDLIAITFERLQNEGIPLLLSLKYPDAQPEVYGVAQTYEVTFTTYEDDLGKPTYTYKYSCSKAGPNPEFTFEGDITE